ncbi:hypothetical protein RRG08_004313 [Elysia crispata]|uniref:Uncharacterized protein n=1 Tax=Elysia crispata TaxID=231223 RepID=A0AAE0YDL7_9GAST|nr:hypothetical protein RRG08_004313 [Elysia crispata]
MLPGARSRCRLGIPYEPEPCSSQVLQPPVVSSIWSLCPDMTASEVDRHLRHVLTWGAITGTATGRHYHFVVASPISSLGKFGRIRNRGSHPRHERRSRVTIDMAVIEKLTPEL